MKILAVIPARSGSRRIKDKNLQEINGKTLIELACESVPSYVDITAVSTDDQRIAKLVQGYDVDVLWRPAVLAEDSISALAVWQHAAMLYPDWDATILLQPSTPTRLQQDIDRCLDELKLGYLSSCTVSDIPDRFRPGKSVIHNAGLLGFPHIRQSRYFTRDGACFCAKPEGLWDFYKKCRAVHSDHYQVNIDEPIDLEIARLVMK